MASRPSKRSLALQEVSIHPSTANKSPEILCPKPTAPGILNVFPSLEVAHSQIQTTHWRALLRPESPNCQDDYMHWRVYNPQQDPLSRVPTPPWWGEPSQVKGDDRGKSDKIGNGYEEKNKGYDDPRNMDYKYDDDERKEDNGDKDHNDRDPTATTPPSGLCSHTEPVRSLTPVYEELSTPLVSLNDSAPVPTNEGNEHPHLTWIVITPRWFYGTGSVRSM
ncbi:hypothetical protein FRC14_008320 [Serendipita sp. 396]|nr:hypothetical protein FRC14_008320 [Serendipita sp. 396]KAG8773127.1 hypothetical protein FRC15_002253 [Serendipita sp. 397]KAG8790863.1 hypothetical protein FRC16_000691 [Serendipita sp. 398]KAG8862191.1 hypothetical protein FRC20_011322 [Serendipita sp. 405]